ncbi:LOW QUALITY PROTEIN: vanin-like protein 3 [Drosophila obscura]|uniref:LOW QUALITY PROTEIN: vanin-like protein 3 n=1 Tax=Drosophila obscura TaxID=7282 RepID=UPI001BB209B7|nr:LOW QUALITY PROTEIN: vanin-like protein 3 [Drosophila obscura]
MIMWLKRCRLLFCVVLVVHLAGRPITGNGDFYTAGVAEFRPAVFGGSSEQLLEENLQGYLELIGAANGSSDILVFPEATLNSVLQLTAVPAQTEHSLCEPHDGDDPRVAEFLRRLACAARNARTYLVVNVKERAEEEATSVGDRGYSIYNTNVVFDRNGAVVSRYRKWNLYLEPLTNRTPSAELATFRTDFGVTFGHFICFDMLFYTPAQELVERLGMRHVIVTKMFNSELPFLTASQLQQGWAWANNVTLLAAGASMPQAGISGSGIYAGQRGALTRIMVSDRTEGQRQLLLAQVPTDGSQWTPTEPPPADEGDGAGVQLKLLQQPDIGSYATWALPLVNGSSASKRLCQADLCCDFRLSWNLLGARPEYHYRLGVSVAERRYEQEQYSSIRVCGLFACRDGSLESCGLLSNRDAEGSGDGVEFTALRISGEFVRRTRRLLMPSTLTSALYALQPSEVAWTMQEVPANDSHTHTQLELCQPQSHLLTFALYGNYFEEFASSGVAAVGRGMLTMWLLLLTMLACA